MRLQTTPNVFTTETDVVFSSGFERRPLRLRGAVSETDGPARRTDDRGSPGSSGRCRPRPRGGGGSDDALADLYDRHGAAIFAVASG